MEGCNVNCLHQINLFQKHIFTNCHLVNVFINKKWKEIIFNHIVLLPILHQLLFPYLLPTQDTVWERRDLSQLMDILCLSDILFIFFQNHEISWKRPSLLQKKNEK